MEQRTHAYPRDKITGMLLSKRNTARYPTLTYMMYLPSASLERDPVNNTFTL